MFSNIIHTECSGVEKSTEIYFGASNGIDVDNDPDTGVNGMDIEAQYFFMTKRSRRKLDQLVLKIKRVFMNYT